MRFESSENQEWTEGQIVRRSYGDYRRVDELEVPFLQEVTVGGEPYSVWQLETVSIEDTFDGELCTELKAASF